MEKSQSIQEIAKALASFQSQMDPLNLDAEVKVKTKSGSTYSFKYATFGNIVKSCRDKLAENGLSISQLVGEGGSVTTLLMHSSGEFLQNTLTITSEETNPQAIGSAISYAKRYSYASILGLVSDQDDDANIAEGNGFKAKTKKEPAKENPKESEKELPWITDKQVNEYTRKIQDGVYNNFTPDSFTKLLHQHFKVSKANEQTLRHELEFQHTLMQEEPEKV